MGQEVECRMRWGRRSLAGKALLETDYLLFRGGERLKIAFRDLTSVTASEGVLYLGLVGGMAELELGKAAERWAQKILHPPSRADKLGVKAGATFRLVGKFDADFVAELQAREAALAKGPVDLIFLAAPKRADLANIRKLAAAMKPNGALWVIYPKGIAAIREIEVIEAGRAAGLKDVKVAAFSATHTALKFVIPVDKR